MHRHRPALSPRGDARHTRHHHNTTRVQEMYEWPRKSIPAPSLFARATRQQVLYRSQARRLLTSKGSAAGLA
ncbi:hypothetical protein E2C01_002926 [Portunus trituberculatus]|uniref:Uncharacterized protein n=1 Tax=Portunus trituberculatus TaxID=210409 RepID=A0A5B7CNT6_PORTR|nr:hypothetical protein [Portunus trituberculatus]